MFFHSMRYSFLTLIRTKSQVFWCFAFPLILGTMFYFAFGGLGADEVFSPIPVAVVVEDTGNATADEVDALSDIAALSGIPADILSSADPSANILALLDSLGEPGEDQFLEITYASEEDALALLEKKEIYGIIHVNAPDISDYLTATDETAVQNTPLSLTISAEMNSDPLNQSILSAFVEQFNLEYETIADICMTNPEKLPEVLDALSVERTYIAEDSLGSGSLDESLTYFFNLIAMTCLFAAMAGSDMAISNQANLSALGARRCISPVPHLVALLGSLSAVLLFEFLTVLCALFYFIGVLKIDFGAQFGYVALASLCGCLTGITLGFLIGCIGRFNNATKFGILMAGIMVGCMLSGLMIGNMRMYVEKFCPLINRINPAALISDAFYSLTVYPSHERFFSNIAGLLLISALFCLGGFALVRRKKYASL